jgi:hypothetical protein
MISFNANVLVLSESVAKLFSAEAEESRRSRSLKKIINEMYKFAHLHICTFENKELRNRLTY